MQTTTVASSASTSRSSRRYIAFRIVALAIALIFVVLFGVWQSILTPWLTMPESGDHGWVRTPELHRLADTASALLMGAVSAAALALALRPSGRSAVTAWAAGTLTMMGVGSLASTLLQGHDPVSGIIFTAAWIVILVTPFTLLNPERQAVLRGGTQSVGGGPRRPVQLGAAILGIAGLALAIGVIGWRMTGGVFENSLEDDVVGVAMLGVSVAGGALLIMTNRQGWRPLGFILAGMIVYAVVAGISIAVI